MASTTTKNHADAFYSLDIITNSWKDGGLLARDNHQCSGARSCKHGRFVLDDPLSLRFRCYFSSTPHNNQIDNNAVQSTNLPRTSLSGAPQFRACVSVITRVVHRNVFRNRGVRTEFWYFTRSNFAPVSDLLLYVAYTPCQSRICTYRRVSKWLQQLQSRGIFRRIDTQSSNAHDMRSITLHKYRSVYSESEKMTSDRGGERKWAPKLQEKCS